MRIIAGKYRGISLLTFEADNIRPTVDRVRENIFNKIQFNIPGAKVLDLFGGTGAISLEFLSRGADEVIICDNNSKSIDLIKKNYAKVSITPNLINSDYTRALALNKGKQFDIIFLDPPYDTDFGEKSLSLIEEYLLLDDEGIIIYEHLMGKIFKIPSSLEIFDERKYGTVVVTFMRKK
ncbi:MAG: 16S rRNA (guanine(966)-N(2))-methyltransferase RsmD [Clostridiales bacterium]|nr:16S rRNA (guanine(966)-N(2))-methyltransferase RsmD [Clostridiales bacterium]